MKIRTEHISPVIATDGEHTWVDTTIEHYQCDNCGKYIHESYPHYKKGNYHLCLACSFKLGYIDSKTYLECSGILLDNAHATVKDGEIVIWFGNPIPPWERTNRQQRNTPQYAEWRKKVFERDNYTCQKCGQRGGKLNAHHIKPFRKYKSLRYEVANGITLCEKCHREEHRKHR